MLYRRIFLSIHPIYTSLHLLILNSQPSPLLYPTPLATTHLFFMSLVLFLFHSWVHLCHILEVWCGPFLQCSLNLLQHCLCFTFLFFGHEACGILAPQPGIKSASLALEREVLTTGPPGKSHHVASYIHV